MDSSNLVDSSNLYVPADEVKYWGNPNTGIPQSIEIPMDVLEEVTYMPDHEAKKQLIIWYKMGITNEWQN